MAPLNIERHFRQRANVYYVETLSDGYGGFKTQWVRKYYQVACRAYGYSGQLTIEEEGVKYPVEMKMLSDVNIDIAKGDKVEIDGVNYLVLRSNVVQADTGHHTASLLGRITGEQEV